MHCFRRLLCFQLPSLDRLETPSFLKDCWDFPKKYSVFPALSLGHTHLLETKYLNKSRRISKQTVFYNTILVMTNYDFDIFSCPWQEFPALKYRFQMLFTMDNVTSKQADVVHTTTVSERFFEDSFSRPRGVSQKLTLALMALKWWIELFRSRILQQTTIMR